MKKPDWRKEENYAYLTGFNGSPAAWAWEFLRRNKGYRDSFNSLKFGQATLNEYLPEKLSGETDMKWQNRCIMNDIDPMKFNPETSLARKWGLSIYMYDPDLNATELEAKGKQVKFDTGVQPIFIEKWDDIISIPTEEKDGVTVVHRDYLLVGFDLTRGINEQVNILRRNFKAASRSGEKKLKSAADNKKPKKNVFKNCLRALDGIEDGNKHHVIRDVLFPNSKSDKDVKIFDCIESAKNNRDGAYRVIAKRRSKVTDV